MDNNWADLEFRGFNEAVAIVIGIPGADSYKMGG